MQNKDQFSLINQLILDQIANVKVKCFYCKQEVSHSKLDKHELHCGKCNLCNKPISTKGLNLVEH